MVSPYFGIISRSSLLSKVAKSTPLLESAIVSSSCERTAFNCELMRAIVHRITGSHSVEKLDPLQNVWRNADEA